MTIEKDKTYLVSHIQCSANSYSDQLQDVKCLEVAEGYFKFQLMSGEIIWFDKSWDINIKEVL